MKGTRVMYYERIKRTRKEQEINEPLRVLYMVVFKAKNLEFDSWVTTESSISAFERLKGHRNFFGAIIYHKKDNEKAFLKAEMIVKEGLKGKIIDMTKEG